MKTIYIVSISLMAGLVGGIVGTRLALSRESASPQKVVRATAFELIDETGQVISYWGVDKNNWAVLAFGNRWPTGLENDRSQPSPRDVEHQVMAIGVTGDERGGGGFLNMRAPDGKSRAQFFVNMWGKPVLMMGDETGTRMTLGHLSSDTPGPQDNDWALNFVPDSATIGMFELKEHGRRYVKGSFTIHRDKEEYPLGQSHQAK